MVKLLQISSAFRKKKNFNYLIMAYDFFLGNYPELTVNWLYVRRNSNHTGL